MKLPYDFISESTLSTIMQELVSQQAPFTAKEPKFVCSMSTCPIATTMINNVGANSNSHDWLKHCDLCTTGKCMFYSNKNKYKEPQFIDKKNPLNRELKPICWLTLVKYLSYHAKDIGKIDPATIEFDLDSRGVLDEVYSAEHRGTSVKGYDDVTGPDEANYILGKTYWYARYSASFKVRKKIKALYNRIRHDSTIEKPWEAFNKTLRSILLTMNGILIKKILFLPRKL